MMPLCPCTETAMEITKFKFHLNRHKFSSMYIAHQRLRASQIGISLWTLLFFPSSVLLRLSLMWLMVKYCVQKAHFHNDRRLSSDNQLFCELQTEAKQKSAPVAHYKHCERDDDRIGGTNFQSKNEKSRREKQIERKEARTWMPNKSKSSWESK